MINQNFSVKSPNSAWFGEITYIPIAEGTLYLSTYIDAYSSRVINYRIDHHMRDELVIESLKTALLKKHLTAGFIIHVDQGSQYTSHHFLK
ncbi:DDE-type integrase/transposase/recombinase [Enterococcus sp. DIV1420a]|uniref:DDE-type integrase/transposase/recombinase n=1 Tax=Enterococcus sp. DIV1420a TaxID=2774672 RepID=UPI003F685842